MGASDLLSSQSTAFDARRWVAEELALQLGWLSECPYHGEPFKSAVPAENGRSVPASAETSGEIYVLAATISNAYPDRCRFCERESALPE
jgi:hypothetical protein